MKVKVKVKSIGAQAIVLINESKVAESLRSCGVVRSIMSPSRGDDPGSNPGTSTKLNYYLGIFEDF